MNGLLGLRIKPGHYYFGLAYLPFDGLSLSLSLTHSLISTSFLHSLTP